MRNDLCGISLPQIKSSLENLKAKLFKTPNTERMQPVRNTVSLVCCEYEKIIDAFERYNSSLIKVATDTKEKLSLSAERMDALNVIRTCKVTLPTLKTSLQIQLESL